MDKITKDLAEALEHAESFAMAMHSIFSHHAFTDRYDDAGRCKRILERIRHALDQYRAQLEREEQDKQGINY